jgi:diadenosine tetraphosphate (Ap4A) HIT family hydrolase
MTFALHPTLAADSVPVTSLGLSDVRLIRDARYPWTILVPRVAEVRDVYQLSEAQQQTLTRESAQLSRALVALFAPFKLNVAALGNMVPQLHLHHIARSPGDAAWPRPVWGVGDAEPYTDSALTERVHELQTALARTA